MTRVGGHMAATCFTRSHPYSTEFRMSEANDWPSAEMAERYGLTGEGDGVMVSPPRAGDESQHIRVGNRPVGTD
jgi:hypothetical protein